jgi:hypothetical protein
MLRLLPKQMPLKVLLPRQKRRLQQLLLRQTPSQLSEVDDDDNYEIVDLDLHRSYVRPKLIKAKNLWDDDQELPKHITDRLATIREKALQKYREVML